MSSLLKDWLLKVMREFEIEFKIVRINPDELWADKTELDFQDKVDALGEWSFHNEQNQVPLIIFNGEKIDSLEDIKGVLQIA